MIEIESTNVTEIFTGFGERGVRAEAVADTAVKAARQYLSTDAAAGEYLADQLIIPMALAGGGTFTATRLSRHMTTNIEIVRRFLDVSVETAQLENRSYRVEVK
jgi:RNA 3'-terminal phosphate cyclase (ATP)